MSYNKFIKIFKNDYVFDGYYSSFLVKDKFIKSVFKGIDLDKEFYNFLILNKLDKDEMEVFLDLYNKEKKDIDRVNILYKFYRNKVLSLDNIKEIDDCFSKIIKERLNIDLDSINDIDKENILIFLSNYMNFKAVDFIFEGDIELENVGLKGDLNFFKVLGINKVRGSLILKNNKKLKSLKGCPQVTMNLDCSDCGIEHLDLELEFEVGNIFNCNNNKELKNLKDCPSFVINSFYCIDCGLEELGMNKKVEIGSCFNCNGNKNLTSLRNGPKFVGGNFYCMGCNIKKIDLENDVIIKGKIYY